MDAPLQISDIKSFVKGVIRRRKKGFILTFILIFVLIGVFALILPPVYRSETTILVEGQQIPQDYVKSTVTSYVEERLQVITRQIMSRAKLLGIINQFNLYSKIRQKHTKEEILTKMRKDIELKTISAHVKDQRSGRSGVTTIAFTLSYEGKNPSTVQKVANTLASLYLEEELKNRARLASTTTAFFQEELENLKKQINVFEDKIKKYKETHIGELPEHNSMNLQRLNRSERDLDRVIIRITSVEERKLYLKGQIANVDPLMPIVTEEGNVARNPKERLKSLRLRLISLQSTLSQKHPDIIKLNKEIKELESQVGKSDDAVAKVRRLSQLEGQLAALKGKLGPKHPDVIKLSREVRMLSKEVDELQTQKVKIEVAEEKPDNATYISLMTQIATADVQMEALLKERKKVMQEIDKYRRKVENAPVIEKAYNELTRDYESSNRKYQDLLNKRMEAKIAQGMETTQRGERFTIIDPAPLPEKPYKPNRMMIIILGLVLALGTGVGLAAAQEGLDNSVKGSDELHSLTGVPVFSTISLMESDEERRARLIRNVLLILAAIGVIVAALVLVNQFVMPLDILWAKILRRLAMMELQF